MTLPATLFPPDVPTDCKLQVVAYRSGSFFPLFGNSSRTRAQSRKLSVNSPVVYVGLGEDEDDFSPLSITLNLTSILRSF